MSQHVLGFCRIFEEVGSPEYRLVGSLPLGILWLLRLLDAHPPHTLCPQVGTGLRIRILFAGSGTLSPHSDPALPTYVQLYKHVPTYLQNY